MSFQEFVNQYSGVANVGDTPENKGQCVGLIETWLDALKLNTPHLYGNACDLLNNADSSRFVIVNNSPTNSPSEGDIVVWGKAFNGNYGHTGIATANCNDAILEVFEQNDPLDSPPHIKTYNYDNVLGWLHPRTLPGTQNVEVQPTINQVQEQLKTQVDATSQCLTQLKTAQDQVSLLQEQLTIEVDKNKDLTDKLSKLQLEYDESAKEVVTLNDSLSALASSNKDYGQQAIDARSLAKDTQNYLYTITDKLGITRTNLKDADVTMKCLIEIDGMDSIIAEQDKQINMLKKMPMITPQILGDIKKNGLSTTIRSFVSLFWQT